VYYRLSALLGAHKNWLLHGVQQQAADVRCQVTENCVQAETVTGGGSQAVMPHAFTRVCTLAALCRFDIEGTEKVKSKSRNRERTALPSLP